ncbi:hypothetical protein N6G95_09330 [Pediococcus inopinatus]|uniref:hypothetical protein n=1 Tax=Pediococcus inopinatus TaxID=114090 RepID=UPI002B25D2EF|nr:hypothetical protein [Pediococcus inopinatus]WPC19406.1 hypothetical protein N6G95_09330 [Pediococcus inopinatus]
MKFSYDTSKLLQELGKDIFEFGNQKVWAYYRRMDGQKIYFDYYFEYPDTSDFEGPNDLAKFDKSVRDEVPNFGRQEMSANDLYELLKDENETI